MTQKLSDAFKQWPSWICLLGFLDFSKTFKNPKIGQKVTKINIYLTLFSLGWGGGPSWIWVGVDLPSWIWWGPSWIWVGVDLPSWIWWGPSWIWVGVDLPSWIS